MKMFKYNTIVLFFSLFSCQISKPLIIDAKSKDVFVFNTKEKETHPRNSDFSKKKITIQMRSWGYGFWKYISAFTDRDGLQFCLGSYDTAIYIAQINTKKFELTFIIKNKTGRESGTRWLNDGDNNPHNDSILQDKPRGEGINLGGTIAQTYGWKETITIS